MYASVRALLAGIIDYAGLFPPAKLPWDQAVRNFAEYLRGQDNWMLRSFVCPRDKLGAFTLLEAELFGPDATVQVSVLTDADGPAPALLDLESTYGGGLRYAREVLRTGRPAHLSRTFCEANFGSSWRSELPSVLALIRKSPMSWLGFKLRCGGLKAAAFPTSEQVAFTIATCRDAGVPVKFTAGLHHAIRHFDAGLKTHMHGFLNVFGAGVLAHARGLSEDQIRKIVEDEDPHDFVFDEDCFRWKDWRATTAEIEAAREHGVISFGSCSFDEPRADVRALGLLDA